MKRLLEVPQFLFIFILFGVKGASVAEIMRIVRWRQWLICGFGPSALCLGGALTTPLSTII